PRHVPAASILDSCLQSFGKSVAAKHREETSCARRTSHRFPVAVAGARIEFSQDRPNHHRVIPNRELRLDRWLVSWFVTQAVSLRGCPAVANGQFGDRTDASRSLRRFPAVAN